MQKLLILIASVVVVLVTPALAQSEPVQNSFWIEVGGSADSWNTPFTGGGDGYVTPTDGPWFLYAGNAGETLGQSDPWGNLNPQPGWVNQWWYDHPYDPTRWKIVRLVFDWGVVDPSQDGGANIIINYTLPGWNDQQGHEQQPPLPGDGDPFIGRIIVDSLWEQAAAGLGPLQAGTPMPYDKTFDLRRDFDIPFNPEWISVDVVGYNFVISSADIPGSIYHECVPEPGMFGLALAVATVGLGAWNVRRRFTK
ncbi:MAG: hypothetical protein ACOY3P_04340 [Planctomycetota bacterium]